MFNFSAPTNLKHRLTTQDATFLYGESNSGPLHIGALGIFEGELPFSKLVKHIEQRLHLIPRYRQRLGFVPLGLHHATWEDDPTFKIENHIKRHRLAKGSDERAMVRAAMRIYERPLDWSRPLWEMHSLEGLPGGRTATVWKIHHCMVDGVSGVELTTVILDFYRDAPPPKVPAGSWKPQPFPSGSARLVGALGERVRANLQSAREIAQTLEQSGSVLERGRAIINGAASLLSMLAKPIAPAPWNSTPVDSRRDMTWCVFPFAEIRTIRGALGGTVNDVVLTMLSEAAARYMKHHEVDTGGRPLRIGCPVNVRHEDEKSSLGNRVSMMFPELPSTPMDPVARLAVVSQETNKIKEQRSPQQLDALMGGGDILPPFVMNLISKVATTGLDGAAAVGPLLPGWILPSFLRNLNFGVNFVATNVPGVQVAQYIAGQECTDSIGLVPLGANLGYGVAITSYNQKLYFGMTANPSAMPDLQVMKGFIEEVYEEIRQAAARVIKSRTPEEAKPVEKPARVESEGATAS